MTLRPLGPADADIEAAFLKSLSPETRHNRLLGGMVRITDDYIRRLTEVDYARDMAIAATIMLHDHESLIGVARYASFGSGGECEFALVVADAWQGRGIGRRTMQKLMTVARGRGMRHMHGDILSSNRGMMAFCQRIGFSVGRHPDDPTLVRASIDLAG